MKIMILITKIGFKTKLIIISMTIKEKIKHLMDYKCIKDREIIIKTLVDTKLLIKNKN